MHYHNKDHHLVIFLSCYFECVHCSAQLKKFFLRNPSGWYLFSLLLVAFIEYPSTQQKLESSVNESKILYLVSSHSIQKLAFGFEWDHIKYRNKPLPLLLPPLSSFKDNKEGTSVQWICYRTPLEQDLDNTRQKFRNKSKLEGKNSHIRTNKVPPWLEQW